MNATYAKVSLARSPNIFRLISHIVFRKLNVEKGPGICISLICPEVGHELCDVTFCLFLNNCLLILLIKNNIMGTLHMHRDSMDHRDHESYCHILTCTDVGV